MFDTMISKSLIQVLWVLMSIGVIISVFVSYQALWQPTGGQVFLHLIYAAVGLIFVRVLCESLIVIFMIHENLERSARSLEDIRSQRSFSSPPNSAAGTGSPAPATGWTASAPATASTTTSSPVEPEPIWRTMEAAAKKRREKQSRG